MNILVISSMGVQCPESDITAWLTSADAKRQFTVARPFLKQLFSFVRSNRAIVISASLRQLSGIRIYLRRS
jgi:hypothetical protein